MKTSLLSLGARSVVAVLAVSFSVCASSQAFRWKGLVSNFALTETDLKAVEGSSTHKRCSSYPDDIPDKSKIEIPTEGDKTPVVPSSAKSKGCLIVVKVEEVGEHDCRLIVVEGAAYSRSAIDLVWKLDKGASKYRFHAKRGVYFPDYSAESEGGENLGSAVVSGGALNYGGVSHYLVNLVDPRNHRLKALSYNVVVERKDKDGDWSICGKVDPVVVNKD